MMFKARILRAIRVAARLGFRISKETAHFIKHLSFLVQRIDRVYMLYITAASILQRYICILGHIIFVSVIYLLLNVQGRILMEMNYMLAYGSAEASLRLLWKFGILEIILPIQVKFHTSVSLFVGILFV